MTLADFAIAHTEKHIWMPDEVLHEFLEQEAIIPHLEEGTPLGEVGKVVEECPACKIRVEIARYSRKS